MYKREISEGERGMRETVCLDRGDDGVESWSNLDVGRKKIYEAKI
jgi:hypothetical protein